MNYRAGKLTELCFAAETHNDPEHIAKATRSQVEYSFEWSFISLEIKLQAEWPINKQAAEGGAAAEAWQRITKEKKAIVSGDILEFQSLPAKDSRVNIKKSTVHVWLCSSIHLHLEKGTLCILNPSR